MEKDAKDGAELEELPSLPGTCYSASESRAHKVREQLHCKEALSRCARMLQSAMGKAHAHERLELAKRPAARRRCHACMLHTMTRMVLTCRAQRR